MHGRLRYSATLILLLITACGAREDNSVPPRDGGDPAPPGTPAPAPHADTAQQPELEDRPATREDTVMIEGMPEVETASLVRAPIGFNAPFSTYVPDGLNATFKAPSSARFTAAFGGTVNENAYMEVYVHHAGAARPVTTELIADLLRSRSASQHETFATETPSWADAATGFRYIGADGVNFTGLVSVGRHGDTYFHVVRHYPVEYGDGLPPRLHTILRLWRWDDTGDMLMG